MKNAKPKTSAIKTPKVNTAGLLADAQANSRAVIAVADALGKANSSNEAATVALQHR